MSGIVPTYDLPGRSSDAGTVFLVVYSETTFVQVRNHMHTPSGALVPVRPGGLQVRCPVATVLRCSVIQLLRTDRMEPHLGNGRVDGRRAACRRTGRKLVDKIFPEIDSSAR